jgi:hypothetical protein
MQIGARRFASDRAIPHDPDVVIGGIFLTGRLYKVASSVYLNVLKL